MMKGVLICSVLCLLFCCVGGLNVLIWNIALSKSHLQLSGRLADLLVQQGHTVDKLILMWNRGNTFNGTDKVREVIRVQSTEPDVFAQGQHLKDPFSKFVFDQDMLSTVRQQVCRALLEDDLLLSKLQHNRYDVALTSTLDFCSHGLFHVLGIAKVFGYSSLPVTTTLPRVLGIPILPSYFIDVITFDASHDMTFFDRAVNMVDLAVNYYHAALTCRAEQALFDDKYGPEFPRLTDLAKKMSLYFVNNNELIHMPRALSSQFVFIGGIGMRNKAEGVSEEYQRLLDEYPAGAIVISFGSYVHSNVFRSELRDAFLETARALPEYLFLWKFENHSHNAGPFCNFPNVHPVDWLPQRNLFASGRVQAFVTHMGLNSYLEAIHYSVPMVAIPLFADQPFNAHSAVRKGMAIVVNKMDITKMNLLAALKSVLKDPSYRKRTALYAQKISTQPFSPQELFLRNFKHASQFSDLWQDRLLQSADQSWIEYTCIDVIGALLVLIVFSGWAAIKTGKTLATYLLSRSSNAEKIKPQ